MAPKPVLIRNRYVLLADVVVLAISAWTAFALRFGILFDASTSEFLVFIAMAILIKTTAFYGFGLYERYWRYASFWDLMAVVLANSVGALVFAGVMVAIRLSGAIAELSRSVLPMDWLLGLALTTGVRASVRILAETTARPAKATTPPKRILVVGAGDAGALVVREMLKNTQLGMIPVAFLDDEPSKLNKRIYGIPVLGPLNALGTVIEGHPVDEVVIAMPRAGGSVVRAVVETCRQEGLQSRVMPGVYELLDGHVGISRLRDVDIVDLLRRPQVQATSGSAGYVKGATIVVTGAGGSIGAELCRQLAHGGARHIVLLGHGENSIFEVRSELATRFPHASVQSVIVDVRDRDRITRVFNAIRPDVVFHAAAHKHVPLMEENIGEAITNNVLGTRNVAEAAAAVGVARLVLVSTDKAVAPSSVMGASKRVAEMIIRDVARRSSRGFVVVRFGNVLGSRGSVVPVFKSQIERGGPVTVTHPDVRRYFMTIPEAVHLVLQAGGLGTGGELFVLDMGQPVLLRELAADMIRLSGFDEHEIPVVFTGLRPGEKLDERLWEEGADVVGTVQSDIRVVSEREVVPADRLPDLVDRMIQAAARDDSRVIRLLNECIPTANLSATPGPWGGSEEARRIIRLG